MPEGTFPKLYHQAGVRPGSVQAHPGPAQYREWLKAIQRGKHSMAYQELVAN